MCNPMEQLISKVYVCFLFQHTQKNAKIVQKFLKYSLKTESKFGSRKICWLYSLKKNGALFSNFKPHCMIYIAEAYFFDIKYTCIYHHR